MGQSYHFAVTRALHLHKIDIAPAKFYLSLPIDRLVTPDIFTRLTNSSISPGRHPEKTIIMENLFNKAVETAKEAANEAAEKMSELKDAATEKFNEVSAKAEEMAAKAKAELAEEAAEKSAELQAAKEKIAAHEGGALGFLGDKAKELLGEAKEELNEAVEEGKGFWEKAKDYVSGDDKA